MICGMDCRIGFIFAAQGALVWLAGWPAACPAVSAQIATPVSAVSQPTSALRDQLFRFYGLPTPASRARISGEIPGSRLKFKLRDQYQIVVRGTIGRFHGLNFLIDTGSVPTMVDWRLARKLGVALENSEIVAFGKRTRNKKTVLSSIQVGSLRVDDLPAEVGDLSFAPDLDAIVGLDVLARASFRIDYEARELTFGLLPSREPDIPLEATPPFLTIQLALAGHPIRLLVDTGSRHLILFERRVHNRLPRLPKRGEKILYHASGASRLFRVSLPDLDIAGTMVDHLEGLLSDAAVDGYPPGIDGVLGVRAVASRLAEFDFERSLLHLQ